MFKPDKNICMMTVPLMLLMTVGVSAENIYKPADVQIPVTVERGGTVRIEAEDPSYPLPEETEITVKDGETAYFIMEYGEPMECRYTISQVKGTEDKVIYDDTTYSLTVVCENAETEGDTYELRTLVCLSADGRPEKYESVHFTNTKEVTPPEHNDDTHTGVAAPMKQAMLLVVSIIMLVVLLKEKKRRGR